MVDIRLVARVMGTGANLLCATNPQVPAQHIFEAPTNSNLHTSPSRSLSRHFLSSSLNLSPSSHPSNLSCGSSREGMSRKAKRGIAPGKLSLHTRFPHSASLPFKATYLSTEMIDTHQRHPSTLHSPSSRNQKRYQPRLSPEGGREGRMLRLRFRLDMVLYLYYN